MGEPMGPNKVLICDDDPMVARAIAREAKAAGWVAVIETTSVGVFPLALKHRPEMIVLDVHQLIDGRQLLTALRRDVRTSGIRIVMMSGSDLPDLRHECTLLGADAFVAKPCSFTQMLPDLPAQSVSWPHLPYHRATILFADDSREMVAALVRAARREGFTTLTDTTSQQVLPLAKQHHPDVIVLDLNQAVDGRDLLCDLKRDPATRDIKVVMLSGVEDQMTRHECFHLGAADYFVKPLDPLFFRRICEIAGMDPEVG